MAIEREEGKPLTLEAFDAVAGARGALNMIFTSLRSAMDNKILVERLVDRGTIITHIKQTQKRELGRLKDCGAELSAEGVVGLFPQLVAESDAILDGSIKEARREGRGRDIEKFEGLKVANKLLLERIQKTSEPS